ncbi:MAG: ATP synthase F0 subunit B [Lachnospiraceae bacterium]|nr:ATP synthase F0 subunit B [Lachnospiraceae bacterium]
MLSFDPINFIFMVINVLILYFIAKKFLFGRVDAIIKKRQEEIDNSYKTADKITAEALTSKRDYETKLQEADKAKEELLEEAAQKAEAERTEIINKANADAKKILTVASQEAESIKKAADLAHDKEVERVVFDVASQLAGQTISEEANSDLYDKFLKQASNNE